MRTTETTNTNQSWFRDAAFGLFIHWGVYAVPGRGEWLMLQERVPLDDYVKLAHRFNPKRYDPRAWAALAKEAGMGYMVLTTRHHDGYCLFDTKTTDFNSVKTAARRDLVGEYAAACREAGIKVGFYYSLEDWRFPMRGGMQADMARWREKVARVHAQLEELMTQYGRVDLLWYDGGFCLNDDWTTSPNPTTAEHWDAASLDAMIRRHQPRILINDRSHLPEDFTTCEQHITAAPPGRLWESCWTMNNHWGYFPSDPLWKPTKQLVQMLTACATGGGNLMLNVGPKPDGTIPAACVRRLREIGRWLKVNGEAIHGVERSDFNTGTAGCASERGRTLYVFVHWWPGSVLTLPKVDFEVKSARILGCPRKVVLERQGGRLLLKNLPQQAPDRLTTTIALERV
ncbi:MAG: alpha-L-fucosidase [Kiritimatiellae bacterium]|nr:alpha-L-fucosidase [Kiritimatiellia bacterium]